MTARGRLLIIVAAAMAASALSGCSASSQNRPAPTIEQVRSALTAHAAAVSHKDRQAFLAGVSSTGAAAGFRTRQGQQFDNLMRLPLTTWTYSEATRTDDHSFEAEATKRYHTAAIIVRVTLSYALRGVDPHPTTRELWWTFIRDGGGVKIAGDDALADAGGISWRGPWDFGPLVVRQAAHSLIIGHPADASLIGQLQPVVDAAVPAVSAVWGSNWTQDVAVIVPGSADELTAQVGRSSPITTDVAAAAVSDGSDPLTRAPLGQRLIVNSAAMARLSAVGQQITVRHEITHIADARDTTDASPRWLVEGFADYVGNLGSGQPVPVAASELRAQVRAGRLPATLPTDAAFDTQGEAPQAYEGSWLACRLIAFRAGQPSLVRFYRLVGSAGGDPDTAVAGALRAVLRESAAAFTAQWRQYLSEQLR